MESGIGRLLTVGERDQWPGGDLRTAFAIGRGYALTAWHCLRDIGGTEAQVWLRLHRKESIPEYIDIPMRHEHHVERLDAALLAIDDTALSIGRSDLTVQELRDLLASAALPLGISVEAHDKVRIAGFPQANPAEWCVMFRGKVSQVDTTIGRANATRLYVDEFAARYPESPKGMSGGPVIRKFPDGRERVVAILSVFPSTPNGQAALGGEVLCRRIADLVEDFPAVGEALRHVGTEAEWPAVLALSPDVQDAYRLTLRTGPVAAGLPADWTLAELSRLRDSFALRGQEVSKAADMLTALCEALEAKRVFLALGGSRLELGRLQVTYRREIGAWPEGSSADALLVEAASVSIVERRTSAIQPLVALARFLVGVASTLGIPPQESGPMVRWISSQGHQLADAQHYYAERRDSPAWLLIDLGDEPRPGTAPWPTTVTWTRLARDGDLAGEPIGCLATAEDLKRALGEIMRLVPPARPLLVDLAVPRALMDEGIEHWPILEVDGETEPLSADCRPRLRWSRRRRDHVLHNRLLARIDQASWDGEPTTPPAEIVADPKELQRWLRNDPHSACFLGGRHAEARQDPLRMLLREGCGFVIWFPTGLPQTTAREIADAFRKVPTLARRSTIPDQLPTFNECRPVIIWDDPRGRDDFALPALAVPETP